MMYNFAEYVRAKRAIRIVLILLGLFLLSAIVLRVVAAAHGGSIDEWSSSLEQSPTAHVTRTTLPDGSKRIVVDDPQRKTHAVIVERPGVIEMDVTEPKSQAGNHDAISLGNVSIRVTTRHELSHTIVRYNRDVPKSDLGILFLFTIPMGMIVASLLGGTLSKENDGHLELAWTKPVSREAYALYAAGIDAAAIVLSQLLTIAATLAAAMLFLVPRFSYGSAMWIEIVMALAGPIAWYACVTAFSASLKRGPGVVIGLGWVAAFIVPGIAQGLQSVAQVNAIGAWFYAIFKGLSYIDPIAYLSVNNGSFGNFLLRPAGSAAALCILCIVYIAVALVQWRRVEA